MASKFGEGPGKNHAYQQMVDSGKNYHFSTYFKALKTRQPKYARYDTNVNDAIPWRTTKSLTDVGRKVVPITMDGTVSESAKDVNKFFREVEEYVDYELAASSPVKITLNQRRNLTEKELQAIYEDKVSEDNLFEMLETLERFDTELCNFANLNGGLSGKLQKVLDGLTSDRSDVEDSIYRLSAKKMADTAASSPVVNYADLTSPRIAQLKTVSTSSPVKITLHQRRRLTEKELLAISRNEVSEDNLFQILRDLKGFKRGIYVLANSNKRLSIGLQKALDGLTSDHLAVEDSIYRLIEANEKTDADLTSPGIAQTQTVSASSPVTGAATEVNERISQIENLLDGIERETQEKGSGKLPEIIIASDYHGSIKIFLNYVAEAISQKTGKPITLDDRMFPETSIKEQLETQNVSIEEVGLSFYLLGDFPDRGPYAVKSFRVAEELIDLGVAKYVTGNHDLWAFLNLMGFHLPVYEGYNFYGHHESERLVEEHWNDSELKENRLGWWTEKLAEYNKAQLELKNKFSDGNVKNVRRNLKKTFLEIRDELTPEEKELWEDLVGFYFGATDVYTGFNEIGMMSVQWWKEKLDEVRLKVQMAKSEEGPVAIGILEAIEDYTEEAAQLVEEQLKTKIEEGKWYWQVFNDINHQNYTSVEWWGKDWSSHKGWGTNVVTELNEAAGSEMWNQANYIGHPSLRDMAHFCRKEFNLYLKDIYGNYYTHGWLPINEKTGQIRFTYKGTTYAGTQIWKGLDEISNDIKDLNTPLSELHEALSLVNSWYADKTTKIKPENIKTYVHGIGLSKIYENIGIKTWFTCHNPLNKLSPHNIGFKVQQDDYIHFSVDKGMSWEKFKDVGAYVTVGTDGIKLRGFDGPDFESIVDNPPTLLLEKDDQGKHVVKTTWENEPLVEKEFLSLMKEQLTMELGQLKEASSPVQTPENIEPVVFQEGFDYTHGGLRFSLIYDPNDVWEKGVFINEFYDGETGKSKGAVMLEHDPPEDQKNIGTTTTSVYNSSGILIRVQVDPGKSISRIMNEFDQSSSPVVFKEKFHYTKYGFSFSLEHDPNGVWEEGVTINTFYNAETGDPDSEIVLDRSPENNHKNIGTTTTEVYNRSGRLVRKGVVPGNIIQRTRNEIYPSSSPIEQNKTDVGGINLNPNLLNLQIKRDGNGIPLPMNLQPIHQMRIDGFVPVIINVTPVVNLPLLLGMVDNEAPFDSANTDSQEAPFNLSFTEKYRNKYANEYDYEIEDINV
ncbi:hypothetical protein KAR91_24315 [Candidatus Pacearchaeota archaeon]|nr:hypothetical protein [Candidatus Pacearchaeota archaeon]